jgi:hypothetical protein
MLRRRQVIPIVLSLFVVGACDDDTTDPEPETFSATLTGAAERPNPVTTDASGSADFTVRGSSVDFEIRAENLEDATAAHIHGPAGTDQAAGVLVTLFVGDPPEDVADGVLVNSSFPSATNTLATGITMDSVLVLMRNGNAYVNVHTLENQPGEIRGQVSSN